jgi:hypothetical protein
MPVRQKSVRGGDWRTLEWFWNVTTTGFFQAPAGAQIKIRYGGGWPFGSDSQRQTLDGSTVKRLVVGRASLVAARMQIRTSSDAIVTYVVEPGNVANLPPDINF